MNEIISKWLGECRGKAFCNKCYGIDAPDYENDESAWAQELYGRIEEAEIWYKFLWHLTDISGADKYTFESQIMWELVKSTPAQKTAALSRAIEEVE